MMEAMKSSCLMFNFQVIDRHARSGQALGQDLLLDAGVVARRLQLGVRNEVVVAERLHGRIGSPVNTDTLIGVWPSAVPGFRWRRSTWITSASARRPGSMPSP